MHIFEAQYHISNSYFILKKIYVPTWRNEDPLFSSVNWASDLLDNFLVNDSKEIG
jgi:hypothetical protein